MIREMILRWATARKPHFVIGGRDHPYLLRWWLTPWSRCYRDLPPGQKKTLWQEFVTRLPGLYVHCFLRSDEDRALHCHPWAWNASWLLQGEYIEHTIRAGGIHVRTHRKAGDFAWRWGPAPHRVELLTEREEGAGWAMDVPIACWTLFFTGWRYRDWGFHCEKGFVPWQRFTAADDPGAVGKGCDA